MRRVVITGIGIVSPIGIGTQNFWNALISGKSGIARITHFDPAGLPCHLAGQVPEYRINDFVPKSYRKATKVMARDIELAVIAADDAFKDSGLQSKAYTETPSFDSRRFGCNIGAALISADLKELTAAMATAAAPDAKLNLKEWGSAGMQQLTPLWLLKYLPNMLACHVTIVHELMGPSNTITCQDASSHLAIGEAFRTIQRGDADLAICGGAESRVNHMGIIRQCLLERMALGFDEHPADAVRPFDEEASGTLLGEGGGLFILEEYERATKRGAKIYAEVVGFGASQDTYKITDPDPTGIPYGKAISKALADAKVSSDEVDLLIPHGLGIKDHDRAEMAALSNVFGAKLNQIPLATIKAQIGNLAAGSGVDAATAVLAMHHGVVPPAVNTKQISGGGKLNVAGEAREAKIEVAVSSVYSLGGQNAALVFTHI
jgi:3-oxoacyl-[acyl-carrier-protein] synthase II